METQKRAGARTHIFRRTNSDGSLTNRALIHVTGPLSFIIIIIISNNYRMCTEKQIKTIKKTD